MTTKTTPSESTDLPPLARITVSPNPVPLGVSPVFRISNLLPDIKEYGLQLSLYEGYENNSLDPRNNFFTTANTFWFDHIPTRIKEIRYGDFPYGWHYMLSIGRYNFQIVARDRQGRLRHALMDFLVTPLAYRYTGTQVTAGTSSSTVKVSSTIKPSTLKIVAGGNRWGYKDGMRMNARFNIARGFALDHAGNIYVADSNNYRIRKITPSGIVITIAGSTRGQDNGTGQSANFFDPDNIAIDNRGILYVIDSDRIRKVSPSGIVTTLASRLGDYSEFGEPRGIAIDRSGNIYVSNTRNSCIRKITSSGVVTTLAGGTWGFADGTGKAAKFRDPMDITIDRSGNIYVVDNGNHRIRKITPSGVVTTFAGSDTPDNWGGYADGPRTKAKFAFPVGIASDHYGNLYVTDIGNDSIRKISNTGIVSTLCKGCGAYRVAVDLSGKIYFCNLFSILVLSPQ